MVSVSLFAGLPHEGQATFTNSSIVDSGFPFVSKPSSSGSLTGRSLSGTGDRSTVVAVNDGYWSTPVSLSTYQPISNLVSNDALRQSFAIQHPHYRFPLPQK
ncbi:ANM_HP_G0212870.mRNA.1.CDS.1 [Saccharomyces cerevisiae]|nr:ANM_HP_G0212870.mRNA.1.CDS.1 [Saccharomyces cerevisiae]CAI6972740.1 ANM_HP_G0212870.mRNA.1.CDS.1 [Saccharomyces cerevisiae]